MWIVLSIFGAFFQASSAAIKKKMLQAEGLNNFIGFVSFVSAGMLFAFFYFMQTGNLWFPSLSLRFYESMAFYAGLNVIAVWFMYKALDLAEFNYLMPFMTLTSLSMIIPPIIFLGEMPNLYSCIGISLVVAGVLYMSYGSRQKKETLELKKKNTKGVLYFLVTAICFTFAPTAAKISIQESSVLFASCIVHLLIGFGFLLILILANEKKRIIQLKNEGKLFKFILVVAFAGLVIFFENGSINTALSKAPVAYVMALKRLMPFFAFLIGYFYFKERTDLRVKMIGTVLLIIGAITISVFG